MPTDFPAEASAEVPADLPAPTASDLLDCGYSEALAGALDEFYPGLAGPLGAAARAADEEGAHARSRALRLLAELCAMRLDADDASEPYKPGYVAFADGRRSAIPDDYDAATLAVLAQAAPAITHPLLRARLADVVWTCSAPRDVKQLELAIDSYRTWIGVPALARWVHGQDTCVTRALTLGLSARGFGEGLHRGLEMRLLAAFDLTSDHEEYPVFWLVEPLWRLKLSRDRAPDIGARLDAIAQARQAANEGDPARAHWQWAERWYAAARNTGAVRRVQGEVARSLEGDGDAHASRLVAMNLYDRAIQIWNAMERQCRLALGGAARVDALRAKLAAAGRDAIDEELRPVAMPAIDVTDLVVQTRALISGHDPMEALTRFARLYPGPDAGEQRRSSAERMHQSVVGRLFGSTTLAADGRPIARQEGGAAAVDEGDLDQRMVQDFILDASFIAHSQIMPALDVLRWEHNLRRGDWEALAEASALVSAERASLVARGLHAGYQGDFVTGLHFLAPQLEHIVRHHLQRAGAHTSTIVGGIVQEKGLSALVAMPQCAAVFGPDVTFEIDAVFCDKNGPNFRNDLAHGLILEDQLHGRVGVYAWWMVFRLVFNVFWNRRRQPSEAQAQEAAGMPASAA